MRTIYLDSWVKSGLSLAGEWMKRARVFCVCIGWGWGWVNDHLARAQIHCLEQHFNDSNSFPLKDGSLDTLYLKQENVQKNKIRT